MFDIHFGNVWQIITGRKPRNTQTYGLPVLIIGQELVTATWRVPSGMGKQWQMKLFRDFEGQEGPKSQNNLKKIQKIEKP